MRKLTIGIAVYNIKEEYLRASIESVLSGADSDAEIIIADDCSEESCGAICREYSADERVRYIRCEENLGISGVRNKIISEANGEWIVFADGDDAVSEHFSKVFEGISDSLCDVIIFDYAKFSQKPPEVKIKNASPIPLAPETVYNLAVSAVARYDLYKTNDLKRELHPNSVWAAAYRREFLLDNKISFDRELKTAEDSLFNAEVYLKNPRVISLDEVMYFYRINPESVTNKYNKNSKDVTDKYLNAIGKCAANGFGNDKNVFESFHRYRCIGAIIDNFDRNIFHPDNPKSRKERKADLENLLSASPYKDALCYANECETHRQRLILKLSKSFAALDFAYKHPSVFKLYGGISRRFGILKRK